jgi:hypothetical protein
LNDTHAISLPQNAMSIFIVTVFNILGRHEELNLIYLFLIQITFGLQLFNLLEPLLLVAGYL